VALVGFLFLVPISKFDSIGKNSNNMSSLRIGVSGCRLRILMKLDVASVSIIKLISGRSPWVDIVNVNISEKLCEFNVLTLTVLRSEFRSRLPEAQPHPRHTSNGFEEYHEFADVISLIIMSTFSALLDIVFQNFTITIIERHMINAIWYFVRFSL